MTVRSNVPMAHNGTQVVLAQVENDVVSAIKPAVLVHQTPAKLFGGKIVLEYEKYFQFQPVGTTGMADRIKADPKTGMALGTETYSGFRFMAEGQEVAVGQPLPVYAYLPPAKVDDALKPVSKTAEQRMADREVAQAASAVRKAQKAEEKASKDAAAKLAKEAKVAAKTVKAENDSKANPKSTSANAKAKIEGVEKGSAVQTKLRALKLKKEAEKAAAADAVAVEIAAGEAEVVAEIAGILA